MARPKIQRTVIVDGPNRHVPVPGEPYPGLVHWAVTDPTKPKKFKGIESPDPDKEKDDDGEIDLYDPLP